MPIYGYHCDQCGHELEVLQSMSDPPLKVCPNCMGPLRKMIYPAGIIFKGSGYYTTDYKSAGSPSRHGDSDAAAAKSDRGGEGGSAAESKGEAKTESKSDSKSDSKTETKATSKGESKGAAKDAPKPSPAAKPSPRDGVS